MQPEQAGILGASTAHPVGVGPGNVQAASWWFGRGEGALPRWSPVSGESALTQASALPMEKEKHTKEKASYR